MILNNVIYVLFDLNIYFNKVLQYTKRITLNCLRIIGLHPHPIFGKIFEKVIYERLYSFMVSQNLMNPCQFGFQKGHSTSHALNYSINHIQEALKKKKLVLGIFIDLSKAFDTFDHKTLLHKLSHNGIRGNANMLLESYLSNRVQYIHALNTDSEKLNVIYGRGVGMIFYMVGPE